MATFAQFPPHVTFLSNRHVVNDSHWKVAENPFFFCFYKRSEVNNKLTEHERHDKPVITEIATGTT
jgi:hypothetical protein